MNERCYPSRPHVAVGVVVLAGETVLLIRRAKAPRAGEWSIPGGAQQAGEPLTATARREVFEETGLAIALGGLIDALDYIERDAAGRVRHHYTLIDFWARADHGQALRAGGDAAEARWVPLAAVASLGLWEETVRIIQKAAQTAQMTP
ncbi:MAG: NUDIX hydrolase [Pseudomonadota bacterium]|jgi:8-oxo-dGTP diphosphatase